MLFVTKCEPFMGLQAVSQKMFCKKGVLRNFAKFTVKQAKIFLRIQINIFTEMVICVAVACKSDSRQGKAKIFISQERKSVTAMAHKNKT